MIVDIHNHVGFDSYSLKERTAEALLQEMDETGVDRCVIFPFTNNPDIKSQNQVIEKAFNEHPDRFTGFFTMNPKLPDMPELMEQYVEAGFKGVVTDPRYGVSAGAKLFHDLVECAVVLGIPVWLHSDEKEAPYYRVSELSSLMRKYSGARFILSSQYKDMLYIASNHHNVVVDTAVYELGQDMLKVVSTLGTLRIMMGTNTPLNTLKHEMDKLTRYKELTGFQKSLLTGRNAKTLLKL